ncbi:MAG: zinc carboxypeptidase [Candidatus Marinimicrobia bacterium]|nr:zinc carboxypeptidase [Candidatus Neomarinimicrobiota bacterium]
MKNTCIIIAILTLWILSVSFAEVSKDRFSRPEIYFRFQIESKDELIEITRIISIDNVIGDTVYAYANRKEFEKFQKLNKKIEILPAPSLMFKPEMSQSVKKATEWDSYPTYDAYVSMMYQFAEDYPEICRIDSIGASVNGRAILFTKISDNVNSDEAEPEFLYTSTMHGDETTGFVLMLRLIDYLLRNYGVNEKVTYLVDNLEIWINPNANPDGSYFCGNDSVYGAIRYNANSVDLNRNFPDPKYGDHPDGNQWQPETVAMMDFADQHHFVLSANFHGGAEVVNYPWDCWERRHADDEWLIWLCRQYADTVHAYSPSGYMDHLNDEYFNNGIINGYDWYPIYGGRQDYMTYFQHCRETTIEISDTKLLPASLLPAHWEYNRAALLNYMAAALTGIRGEVKYGSDPLNVQVRIIDHEKDNSWVFSDSVLGDYYRLCLPGVYDLEFSNDLFTKVIRQISVEPGNATMENVFIQSGSLGDINNDGFVNITDIMRVVNFITGRLTPSNEEFNRSDWNSDNELNIADIIGITQYILNQSP